MNTQQAKVSIESSSNGEKEFTKSSIYPFASEDINSRITEIKPGLSQCGQGTITPRVSRSLYAEQLLSFMKAHREYFEVVKTGKMFWWKAKKSIPMDIIDAWWEQSEFKAGPRLDLFGTTVPYSNDGFVKAPDMVIEWKLSEEPNTAPGSLLGTIEALFSGQQTVGCEHFQIFREYYTDDESGEVFSKYKLTTSYDYVWHQDWHHDFGYQNHGGVLDNVEMHDVNKNVGRLLKALHRHHVDVTAKQFIPGVFYHQTVQESLSYAKDFDSLKAKIKLISKKKDIKYIFDFQQHPLWGTVKFKYEQWLQKRTNYSWLSAAFTREERQNMEWIHSMIKID